MSECSSYSLPLMLLYSLPYVAWRATRFGKYGLGETGKSSYRFSDILLHFYSFVPLHFSRISVESGNISLKSTLFESSSRIFKLIWLNLFYNKYNFRAIPEYSNWKTTLVRISIDQIRRQIDFSICNHEIQFQGKPDLNQIFWRFHWKSIQISQAWVE